MASIHTLIHTLAEAIGDEFWNHLSMKIFIV